MSGGMLSKPNLHMVQSMPLYSHTWPRIYRHLECTRTAVKQAGHHHIYQPLLGQPYPPERIVHQRYDIKKTKNSLKFSFLCKEPIYSCFCSAPVVSRMISCNCHLAIPVSPYLYKHSYKPVIYLNIFLNIFFYFYSML